MPRVTITVPDKTPQPYRFQLDRQTVTLGRGSENDIAIDSGSVSVKHAEMVRIEGGYELRDVGSTNGIKLDGERYEVIPLRSGLSVKMGDVAFDFLLMDEEMDALGREKPFSESPVVRESNDGQVGLPPLPEGARREEPRRMVAPLPDSGGGGFGMILLFLILAAAAFVAGMAVRFQKDTGRSLLDAIKAKGLPAVAPAVPGLQEK